MEEAPGASLGSEVILCILRLTLMPWVVLYRQVLPGRSSSTDRHLPGSRSEVANNYFKKDVALGSTLGSKELHFEALYLHFSA
jgi:hypothetical protein